MACIMDKCCYTRHSLSLQFVIVPWLVCVYLCTVHKSLSWIDHIELYYLYCSVHAVQNRGERFKLSFSPAVLSNQL